MRPLAALVLGVSATACDGYVRPPDPFTPDGDVVTVGVAIVARQSVAYMLASHPHRPRTANPPVIDATLSGPGWVATFSESVALERCGVGLPERWPGPAACLRAHLPEPIRERNGYTLAGSSPLGAFYGETTVPAAPVVHEPEDTVRVHIAAAGEPFGLGLRFGIVPEVGAVIVEPVDAVQLTIGATTENSWIDFTVPRELDVNADTAYVTMYGRWEPPGFRFDLHLLGFERNYSAFVEHRDERLLLKPWPSFGIEGDEGVYGYFGAGARSRPIPIVMDIGPPS